MPETYKVHYQMMLHNLGWKYIFHSTDASAQDAVVKAMNHRNKLLAFHQNNVLIHHIAAANVDTMKRDHYRISMITNTGINGANPGNLTADVTQTSVLIRLLTAAVNYRFIWLRGIPDDHVKRTASGALDLDSAMRRKIGTWASNLPQAGWEMQSIKPPDPDTDWGWTDVTQLEPEPGSNNAFTIVTCREAHGIQPNEEVTFSFSGKDTNLLGFRNNHKPVSLDVGGDNTKFVVPVTYRSTQSPYFPHRMRVRRVDYDYIPQSGGWDIVDVRSRDTGRAPGPKGREAGVSFR